MSADPSPTCPAESARADLALVRRVQRGERAASERFAARMVCLPRMLGELNRRRGGPLNEQDIEDLAQDVLLVIWNKLQLFEGYGTLERWVYRFAHYQFQNFLRVERRRRKRVRPTDVLPEPEPEPADPATDASDRISEWIADLPPDEGEVVALKHEQELAFSEMSARTGVSPSTYKARYYKALTRLRLRLADRVVET